MAVLESRLIIGATDDTAAAFASVEARIKALQASTASINPAVGAVGRTAANVAPAAAAVEKTSSSMGGFIASAAEFAAAAVGLKAAVAGVTQAFDQAHENIRMAAAGMSPEEISDAGRLAKDIGAKYPVISPSSAANLARNARSIVGTYEEAAPLIDQLAQLRVVAKGANIHASDEELDHEFDQLIKGIEIRGATQNPAAFRKHMEFTAKGLNAFGDTLSPSDYYEMYKYGRQATPTLSDKFMLETAPSLAQELKGSSYGRAVSGFYRAIVEGHMEHDSLKALAQYGLVADDDLLKTKTGEIKGLKPGRHIKDYEKAATDPFAWVTEDLGPAISKAGVTGKVAVGAEVGRLFSNAIAAQMVNILLQQQPRIEKDQRIVEGAEGTDAWKRFSSDPKIASEALGHAIASSIAQNFSGERIGSGLNWLAHWMAPQPNNNPFANATATQLMMDAANMNAARDRTAVMERFPGAFGPGVLAEDAERISRRRINESYRWQKTLADDPEAHRGAVMMNLGTHQAPPQEVSVHGDATVNVPVTVTVTATSELLRIVDDAKNATKTATAQMPLNPVAGGHSGRMDSDAAPTAHRIHGPH